MLLSVDNCQVLIYSKYILHTLTTKGSQMKSGIVGLSQLAFNFDAVLGTFANNPLREMRLGDLSGVFIDEISYKKLLANSNPIVYSVTTLALADGPGDLHCALAQLLPGRVGDEYFMTRGHYHAWRDAAELYVGLAGRGMMLLEDTVGNVKAVPLVANSLVYVPGYAAHRTVNIGSTPLTYLGIYPAHAGHDYAPVAADNFLQVVISVKEQPLVMMRADYLAV